MFFSWRQRKCGIFFASLRKNHLVCVFPYWCKGRYVLPIPEYAAKIIWCWFSDNCLVLRLCCKLLFFRRLQGAKKRSDVEKIISDIIFSMSYVVFPMSNVFFVVLVMRKL